MNILFCDDEEAILDLYLSEIAHSLPEHNLYGAKDGQEGLKVCQENKIDLVLTDGKMPIKDGVELSKDLQSLPNPPKVYMITGYAGTYDEDELKKYGIIEVFYKPLDFDWLIEFISTVAKEI